MTRRTGERLFNAAYFLGVLTVLALAAGAMTGGAAVIFNQTATVLQVNGR